MEILSYYQPAWSKMQTLRDLPAEVAWEMCWNSLSHGAWAFFPLADFIHKPHHASLLQSFPIPPQQSGVATYLQWGDFLLGELSFTWQKKFLRNEWSLTICEVGKGLEMSFQFAEGFW